MGTLFQFRVWHDDIRPAPDGWTWARTNAEAMKLLSENEVSEISLDHDLGLHDVSEEEINADPELLLGRGQAEETGLDLVKWMIANERVPPKVTIHSWNPAGAERMALALVYADYDAPLVAPFQMPRAS